MAKNTTITVNGKPVYTNKKEKRITNRRMVRMPGGGNVTGSVGMLRPSGTGQQLYQGTWGGKVPTMTSTTTRTRPSPGGDWETGGIPSSAAQFLDRLRNKGKNLTNRQKAERAANEAKRKQEASKKSALSYFDQAESRMRDREQNVRDLSKQSLSYFKPMMESLSSKGELISDQDRRRLLANRKAEISAQAQNLASGFGDIDSGVTAGRRMNLFRNAGLQSALLPIQTELDVRSANRADFMNRLNQGRGIAGAMSNITGDLANSLRYFNQGDLSLAGGRSGVQTAYQYDPGSQYFNQLGYGEGAGGNTTGGGGLSYFNPVKAGGDNPKPIKKKSRKKDTYINNSGDLVFNSPMNTSSGSSPNWFNSSQYRSGGLDFLRR